MPLLDWRAAIIPIVRDPALRLLRLQQSYGDVVALGRERGAPVCVFAPAYNHQILTDTTLFYSLDVSSSAAPVRMPRDTAPARLLSGVAGMNGERHKRHRHLLLPGFGRKHVDTLCGTVAACIEQHIADWREGQQIDLKHEMIELSLSLAISGLLGLNPREEGMHLRQALTDWGAYGLSPQVALLPFNVPGLPYRRFLKLSEHLERAFHAVMARKRADGLDGGDALSILLQAQDEEGSTLTGDEVLGHLTTFFTAGHETTASALTWSLFLLTQHPEMYARLMEELDGTLHGAAPRLEQLRQMPTLLHVINEGLRMFPPGMWLVRTSTAPFALGPYELPKGTHVVFSPAVTHYRGDLYDQPHRYLPDRWETISPSPYEFLPFGNGSRRCLGATFAMLELQMVLPIILQRFRLEVPPGTRVDRGGTILSFPKGMLPVWLRPRDDRYAPSSVRGNIHDLVELPA